MVFRRNRVNNRRGFTLTELMTVVAVIGIVSMVGTPLFITFLRASETRGAAGELVTLLNQARQMAIATNSRYRVEIEPDNNRLRFTQSADGGNTYVVWTGPGTDNQGYRRLENQARLSSVNVNPTFNHLGTGNTSSITVQDSRSSSSLNVVVSTTGRIRICPPDCP